MKHKKVVARVKGGIGNQLFCYAAARRLALANDAELVLDDVSGFCRDHRYHRSYALDRFAITARTASPRERLEPGERLRRGLAKSCSRLQPFHRRTYVEQFGQEFEPRLLSFRVRGTVYLDGSWQSERYFEDHAEQIRADLRIAPPDDESNIRLAHEISVCESVSLHVRWFDSPHIPKSAHNAPRTYYVRAIEEMQHRIVGAHFFLFSDYPSAALQMLALPEDAVTVCDHNWGPDLAYADLWLMSQCRHHIIANSTFSWWAAWLASSSKTIVIAPAMTVTGITRWGAPDMLPDRWIQVPPGLPPFSEAVPR